MNLTAKSSLSPSGSGKSMAILEPNGIRVALYEY